MDQGDAKTALEAFGAVGDNIRIRSPATPEEAFEHPPLDVKRQMLLKRLSESLSTLSNTSLVESRSDNVIQSQNISHSPPKNSTSAPRWNQENTPSSHAYTNDIPLSNTTIDPQQLLLALAAHKSQSQQQSNNAPQPSSALIAAAAAAALQNTIITNKLAASNPTLLSSSFPYHADVHSTATCQPFHQQQQHQMINPALIQQHLNTMTPQEHLVGIYGEYQPYCHQIITDDLNNTALKILNTVKELQSTDLFNLPQSGSFRGRRYFCSLKEVSKVVHKARLLIIAPNVRPSHLAQIKPVHVLQHVLTCAEAAGVPYVFALSRKGIGQVFGKDKNMSIVAVMRTDQIENEYALLLEQARIGRELYAQLHGSAVNRAMVGSSMSNDGYDYRHHYPVYNAVPYHHQHINAMNNNNLIQQQPLHALHAGITNHNGMFHPHSLTATATMLAMNHPPPVPVVAGSSSRGSSNYSHATFM